MKERTKEREIKEEVEKKQVYRRDKGMKQRMKYAGRRKQERSIKRKKTTKEYRGR